MKTNLNTRQNCYLVAIKNHGGVSLKEEELTLIFEDHIGLIRKTIDKLVSLNYATKINGKVYAIYV